MTHFLPMATPSTGLTIYYPCPFASRKTLIPKLCNNLHLRGVVGEEGGKTMAKRLETLQKNQSPPQKESTFSKVPSPSGFEEIY